MRDKKINYIKEEINKCSDMVIEMEVEKELCLVLQDLKSVKEYGAEISALRSRIEALKTLLEQAENPNDHMDFICSIIVKGT